jgi:hypothetical protein
MMKQMVDARMAARGGGGSAKKDEGNEVVSTSKYCAKAIEDDDDEVNEDEDEEEEENRVGVDAQGKGDDLMFEALFKPSLSSSPTLCFVASRRPCSPFPPSLSLACHRTSTNFSLGLTHHHTSHPRLVGQVYTSRSS